MSKSFFTFSLLLCLVCSSCEFENGSVSEKQQIQTNTVKVTNDSTNFDFSKVSIDSLIDLRSSFYFSRMSKKDDFIMIVPPGNIHKTNSKFYITSGTDTLFSSVFKTKYLVDKYAELQAASNKEILDLIYDNAKHNIDGLITDYTKDNLLTTTDSSDFTDYELFLRARSEERPFYLIVNGVLTYLAYDSVTKKIRQVRDCC
ncbi:MAG: hypothetical protein MRY83_04290 [Flavobacteriales bacterium]|nr:hypothetical protein [Flavobacteriales bacterium]